MTKEIVVFGQNDLQEVNHRELMGYDILKDWEKLVNKFIGFKKEKSKFTVEDIVVLENTRPITASTERTYRKILGGRKLTRGPKKGQTKPGIFETYLRNNKIESPTIHDVKAWLDSLNISPATRNLYTIILKSFFRYLRKTAGYTFCHWELHTVTLENNGHKKEPITEDLYLKMLSSIDTSTLKGKREVLILHLKFEYGLRDNTIVNLRQGDLRQRGAQGDWELTVKEKWKNERREIPIFEETAKMIIEYKRALKTKYGNRFKNDMPLIVTDCKTNYLGKKPISTSYVRELVSRLLSPHVGGQEGRKSAKLSSHSFRHRFVTDSREAGDPDEYTLYITGIKNISTLKRYDHSNTKKRVRERMKDKRPVTQTANKKNGEVQECKRQNTL